MAYTQTLEPIDVIAPTKINGTQKSYELNFPALVENAPFKLIVKNGTGAPIVKQECRGSFIVKIICKLQNAIADLQILKERVAVAEISLNGKKIVTPKNFNLQVASVEMDINLYASNNIKIKTTGFFTSSITYKIEGVKVTHPQILTIGSPGEGAITAEDKITVTGIINSKEPNLRLVSDNFNEDVPIGSDQTFTYEFDYLQTGRNTPSFTLYSGQAKLDSKIITVMYLPLDSNGEMVSSAGGNVAVFDSNNELYGTSVNIPSGALIDPEFILINRGDAWGPNIPYIYEELGATTSIEPNFQYFEKNVTLNFPYHPEKLPVGADIQNIKILGYNEDGWKIIEPKSISTESVSMETNIFNYYAYKVIVEKPIKDGELQILSNISGATIYLDDVDVILRAPATLNKISEGNHTLRVYAQGFNEVIQTFSYPTQKRIYVELQPQDTAVSMVSLDSSVKEKITTTKKSMAIAGTVPSSKINENKDFVVLSIGEQEFVQKLKKNGKFSFNIPVPKGRNKLQVRATINGKTSLSRKVTIRKKLNVSNLELDKMLNSDESNFVFVPESTPLKSSISAQSVENNLSNQEIIFTAQWMSFDGSGTYDVHVYDPDGAHASTDNPGGIVGGIYQKTSNTISFRLPKPKEGKYKFEYDNIDNIYNINAPISMSLSIQGRVIWSHSNSGGNYYGAFATQIYIQPLKLIGIGISHFGDINEPKREECTKYLPNFCISESFTTLPADSDIGALVKMTSPLMDTVKFKIKEVNLGLIPEAEIDTSSGNVLATFHPINNPLLALTAPKISKPLIYEIVAYTDFEETKPAYIVQSGRSQIQQEFIDKRGFMDLHPAMFDNKSFERPTPELNDIGSTAISLSPYNSYTFEKMISFSDFDILGLGIVHSSITYSQQINDAYRKVYPNMTLVLTSGWRNPRRSDQQKDGGPQSYHQSGDAIDLVPPRSVASLDSLKELRDVKLIELCKIAHAATYQTDVIYHANHVHIEPYNSSLGRVTISRGCKSALPLKN